MRIWTSRNDVYRAVKTLKDIYNREGKIPTELIEAYREIIKGGLKGQVAFFFEKLNEECPELVKYFVKDEG